MTLETLESRTLLSAPPIVAHKADTASHASAHRARRHAVTHNYLISFYGLGGTGFDNGWLSSIADTAGGNTNADVRKYQEDEGNQALSDLFSSMDENGDHVLSSAEIDATTLRVVGFSFGAVQASEFTRSLTRVSRPTLGYRLAKPIPVRTLVTLDPVNTTPFKHTDGPVSNVQNFFNYYELNPARTSVQLLNRTTRQAVGSTSLGDSLNPIGGPLPSSALNTSQTLITFGSYQNRSVTQYFSKRYYGTMVGSQVNHTTMPWYLFNETVADLDI